MVKCLTNFLGWYQSDIEQKVYGLDCSLFRSSVCTFDAESKMLFFIVGIIAFWPIVKCFYSEEAMTSLLSVFKNAAIGLCHNLKVQPVHSLGNTHGFLKCYDMWDAASTLFQMFRGIDCRTCFLGWGSKWNSHLIQMSMALWHTSSVFWKNMYQSSLQSMLKAIWALSTIKVLTQNSIIRTEFLIVAVKNMCCNKAGVLLPSNTRKSFWGKQWGL